LLRGASYLFQVIELSLELCVELLQLHLEIPLASGDLETPQLGLELQAELVGLLVGPLRLQKPLMLGLCCGLQDSATPKQALDHHLLLRNHFRELVGHPAAIIGDGGGCRGRDIVRVGLAVAIVTLVGDVAAAVQRGSARLALRRSRAPPSAGAALALPTAWIHGVRNMFLAPPHPWRPRCARARSVDVELLWRKQPVRRGRVGWRLAALQRAQHGAHPGAQRARARPCVRTPLARLAFT